MKTAAMKTLPIIKNITAIKIVVMKKKHLAQIPNWGDSIEKDFKKWGMIGRADYKVIVQSVDGKLGFLHEMLLAKWLSPPEDGHYDVGWAILESLPQIFED